MARAASMGTEGDLLNMLPQALETRVFPEGGKVAAGVRSFLDLLEELRGLLPDSSAVVRSIVNLLVAEEQDLERQGNLLQLARCAQTSYATLSALLRDADEDGGSEDGQEPAGPEAPLTLLTMHASKGLEFDHVILTGMAGGVFPSAWGTTDLGEERRLCYVGITRARERLTLTCPTARLSRFVREMRIL
jgi:DNA helicase-2/ATP-dependent DNA helicase PcrA